MEEEYSSDEAHVYLCYWCALCQNVHMCMQSRDGAVSLFYNYIAEFMDYCV